MYTAEIVKTMRENKGLTQVELAERAQISPMTVYNIESGKTDTKVDTLIRIADACDYDLVFNPRYKGGYL